MKLIAKLIFLLILSAVFFSCKKNPVGPDDSNAAPGRRDYTWVADTINNPFLDFYNIWGNSPSNVWTTGSLMSDGVYYYNGQNWGLDNRVYISDPDAVWGYGNSVWIGNDKGCIWKFTDSAYIEELKDFKVNGNFIDFVGMTGTSNNEIYAAGYNYTNPVIMKYDGSSWQLDKTLSDTAIFNKIIYCCRNDKYYLVSALIDYTTRIYEYDRKDLKLIYNNPPSNAGPTIASIDGYPYIVVGNKIYRYYNGNMEFIFEVDNPNFGGVVWGRSRNDIFIRMQDGIVEYNGSDWKYLYKSTTPVILSPNSAIFTNDVFFPAKIRTTGYPIIYHGALK
jgi:hypothetical protein